MTKLKSTLAVLGVVSAGAAFAGGHSGAVGHGTSANTMMALSESHIVMHTSSAYESFDVASGHPLEGASGPCFGAVEIKAGAVSGGGRCVYDTASGEKAVMIWTAMGMGADGALTGEWSVSGGTGAWASASGSGTFSSLTNPETGKFTNTISGEITMN